MTNAIYGKFVSMSLVVFFAALAGCAKPSEDSTLPTSGPPPSTSANPLTAIAEHTKSDAEVDVYSDKLSAFERESIAFKRAQSIAAASLLSSEPILLAQAPLPDATKPTVIIVQPPAKAAPAVAPPIATPAPATTAATATAPAPLPGSPSEPPANARNAPSSAPSIPPSGPSTVTPAAPAGQQSASSAAAQGASVVDRAASAVQQGASQAATAIQQGASQASGAVSQGAAQAASAAAPVVSKAASAVAEAAAGVSQAASGLAAQTAPVASASAPAASAVSAAPTPAASAAGASATAAVSPVNPAEEAMKRDFILAAIEPIMRLNAAVYRERLEIIRIRDRVAGGKDGLHLSESDWLMRIKTRYQLSPSDSFDALLARVDGVKLPFLISPLALVAGWKNPQTDLKKLFSDRIESLNTSASEENVRFRTARAGAASGKQVESVVLMHALLGVKGDGPTGPFTSVINDINRISDADPAIDAKIQEVYRALIAEI